MPHLDINDIYHWIMKGNIHLINETFTQEKAKVVANALITASSPKELKKITYSFCLYLTGNETEDFIENLRQKGPPKFNLS